VNTAGDTLVLTVTAHFIWKLLQCTVYS